MEKALAIFTLVAVVFIVIVRFVTYTKKSHDSEERAFNEHIRKQNEDKKN